MAPKVNPLEIDRLKIKKQQAIDSIQRISRYVQEHKDDQPSNKKFESLRVRKESLLELFEKLQDFQSEILCLNKNYTNHLDDIEIEYYDTIASINELLSESESPSVNSPNLPQQTNVSMPSSSSIATSHLPPLTIPFFYGKNLTNYKPFIELFTAVVDKSTKTDVEKLCYLKLYLRDEALSLINNLPLVNASYAEALTLLNNRYNNETMLITSHIHTLLEVPSVSKCTAVALREFVSKVRQQTGALKNLKQPVEKWDMILICIFCKKLDQFTNRAYQLDRDSSKLPTLEEFLSYLESRAMALESVNFPEACLSESKKKHEKTSLVFTKNKFDSKCSFCSISGHKLFNCRKFRAISVSQRLAFVERQKICKLCLNNHIGQCKMTFKCSICHLSHNSLLHLDTLTRQNSADHSRSQNQQLVSTTQNSHFGSIEHTAENEVLPTVQLKVRSNDGKFIMARCLLDSGSQVSLVTSSLVKQLNLNTFNNNLNVVGISLNSTKMQKAVNLEIHSNLYDYQTDIKCSIVDKITTSLPQVNFDISNIKIPSNIVLSDNNFNKSGPIDILLSSNIFFQVLLSEKVNIDKLILQNTLFGYVVSGLVLSNQVCTLLTLNCCKSMDTAISQFWQTEKVPEIFTEYSSEQDACEQIFQTSLQIVDNKFQVALPLKQDIAKINMGDSFSVALKRFENLEKRLLANPALFEQYKNFIDEYLRLQHAKIVDFNSYDINSGSVYFMAHHPVIREDKKTTKLRVVFDGSMKSKNKKCLNDFLYNGAVVQNELFDILVLFRTYKYVILSDIKQMYRMISVDPKYCFLQNILWREPNGPLQCLQLQTVTYGLKSSSFLATRCLVELAKTESQTYPLASRAILYNTYVDDIISGGNSLQEVSQLKNELICLLRTRSFELHKFCSNHPDILHDIPKEKQHLDEIDMCKENYVIKTLGLSYDTQTDNFKMSSPKIDTSPCITKRQVLSFISKFYDHLGLVGPVLVAAKVIMQKIWLSKIKWDDILPSDLLDFWQNFVSNLMRMPTISIQRSLDFHGSLHIELVGYCDSSMVAYGAVLYARVIFHDHVSVNLICSKSRIAPKDKDKLSIPRLELNSALLLSNLINKVSNILKDKIDNIFLYSDSNIVLSWIKTDPLQLNPYVANRIVKIQKITSNFKWLYINTNQNPADCLSRGLEPQLIEGNSLWFHGPPILSNHEFNHPTTPFNLINPLPEQKIVLIKIKKESFFENYSSISKLQRIVAYMLRFCHNSRNKNRQNKLTGNLKILELDNSLKVIIKFEQGQHFAEEIKCLNSKFPIKSSLKSLSPFQDHKGLLRIGGRLQNSKISYSQRHPMILPKNSHITDLIIRREHLKLLHAGPRQVLSSLNMIFWLINGVREIKKILHRCVTCFKFKAKCSQQLMGSLPEPRVCPARVFQNVGVDFCGPFLIKQSRLRKSITSKSYIALFVCFAVKAIHMELLSDLTTETFLSAFKRFIARRGKPAKVFCDNGSTFKGASNQISEFYKNQNGVNNFCLEEKIDFQFIPSYSPVFGGLWEAGVKSAKYHIKRVMGDTLLTYEEFSTLIVSVEGILNSRPLMPLSQDPTDLEYLTPGHFLIGTPITSYPEPDVTGIPQNRLKLWKVIAQMQQHFWRKWQQDYLAQLQSRPKWQSDVPNLKEGMMVLLKDDNMPSFRWPVGRIVRVIPGKDKKVRVLEVQTKNGTYLRSITKIAILPIH